MPHNFSSVTLKSIVTYYQKYFSVQHLKQVIMDNTLHLSIIRVIYYITARQHELVEAISKLGKAVDTFGIIINKDKTKFMKMGNIKQE